MAKKKKRRKMSAWTKHKIKETKMTKKLKKIGKKR